MGRHFGSTNKRSLITQNLTLGGAKRGLAELLLRECMKRLGSKDEDIRWDATKTLMPYLFPKLQALSGVEGGPPINVVISKEDAEA